MKKNIRLVTRNDPTYPRALLETDNPPDGLYVLGNLPASTYFAAVGTRRATPEGKTIMRRFAYELAQAGFIIASGLAFGIDAAAHEGCLEAGGKTVAVLAGGLHEIYPHENTKLGERILANGGAVISEYPTGMPPYASNFLERNRIIAGLSRAVLIVEAPDKSGALVTARHAMEENRDVFVVPGSITHGNYKGSHALIRQGAELVTTPEEIFKSYGISRDERQRRLERTAKSEETQILKALRAEREPAHVDKIVAATKLEPQIVNRLLTDLIFKNLVKEKEGGYTI